MWFILESLAPMPLDALHEASDAFVSRLKEMSAGARVEATLLTAAA